MTRRPLPGPSPQRALGWKHRTQGAWSRRQLIRRLPARAALLTLLLAAGGCAGPFSRRSAGVDWGSGGISSRRDPALSGDGRHLASIVERGGRQTLLLQEQPSGRELPLRHLRRFQPHRSPALSWNGRYVAVLVQRGQRQQPLIEDRATGRLLRVDLPPDLRVERLSLSPDGRRIALEVLRGGTTRVQLFELGHLLEADLPPTPLEGRGPAAVPPGAGAPAGPGGAAP